MTDCRPLLALLCLISGKLCLRETIAIKPNVRFQGGICPEKCQPGQIQNGRLEAIIVLNMGNIGKTVPDS